MAFAFMNLFLNFLQVVNLRGFVDLFVNFIDSSASPQYDTIELRYFATLSMTYYTCHYDTISCHIERERNIL